MLKKIAFAVALIAASSTAANAVTTAGKTECILWICWTVPTPSPAPWGPPAKTMAAPEIDPSSAVAGLTLLAGGLAVMVGRRSRRLEVQAD